MTVQAKVGGKTGTLLARTLATPAKAADAIKVKIKRTKLMHGRHNLAFRATNAAT